MTSISQLFGFKRSIPSRVPAPEARATLALASLGVNAAPHYVTVYPPADPGLPVVTPEEIVIGASAKIKRLAEIAGGTASEFERLYMVPLRNLAAQVHLLPATPRTFYSGPCGLFNMCLDVALLARQSAEGKIFVPEATIEVRHRTDGAWRYSAFVAGLLSQLHVPVGSMTVTSPTGVQWPRYGISVYDWLISNELTTYHVIWHEKAKVTGAEGASLLSSVIPADVMDWLATTDSQIIRDINIAVTRDMAPSESILGAILKSVVTRIKEVDALHQPSRFGRLTIGTQFEPHLLNAMRELIEEGTWRCNEPDGTLFWGSDGLYVCWPAGLKDVLAVFAKRSLSSMPHSSVTLAEMLGNSGIIISKDTGVWVHDIVVTDKSSQQQTRSAMRFKDAIVLIGHLSVKPLTQPFGKLLVDSQREVIALAAANLAPAVQPASSKHLGVPSLSPTTPLPPPEGSSTSALASDHFPEHALADVASATPATSPTGDKSSLAKTIRPATSHAVLAHVEEVAPGERLPKDILTRLHLKPNDSAACALGMALEQALQYRSEHVRRLDWGMAICCAWLTDVACFSLTDLASPLDRAGVIAKNPDGKSVALVSKVMFSDSAEPRLALVLKLDFASRLGMPIDAKA